MSTSPAAPAPPAARAKTTRDDYIPTARGCDYYFLFNEMIFSIRWSEHPGTSFLLDYLHHLDVKPSDIDNSALVLDEHPLWSENDAGIVLYEGVRDDGLARSFFHIGQIDAMRTAARAAATASTTAPANVNIVGVPASVSPSVAAFIVEGDDLARRNLDDDLKFHVLHRTPERRVFHTLEEISTLRAFNRARELHAAPRVPTGPAPVPTPAAAAPPATSSSKRKKSRPDPFYHAGDKYLLAKKCYQSQIGTWVIVDLELSRADNTRVTEAGVVVHNPRDGTHAPHHFVVRENEDWRDVKDMPFRRPGLAPRRPVVFIEFVFGTTRHVSLADTVAFLRETVRNALSEGPVYICFHDARTENDHLLSGPSPILPGESHFDLDGALELAQESGFLYYFDTQVLYAGLTGKRAADNDRISLIDLLAEYDLEAPVELWHNAGNDAQLDILGIQLDIHTSQGQGHNQGFLFQVDMTSFIELDIQPYSWT
ncbi:hypothetical protein AURDEDRAFT_168086 [Auricularia subglabra TFB-10046 SS5]|nr:hypothetical protein AURDEDRAFT_168086 [Auricularia subglabra TFB-10046 SS5]